MRGFSLSASAPETVAAGRSVRPGWMCGAGQKSAAGAASPSHREYSRLRHSCTLKMRCSNILRARGLHHLLITSRPAVAITSAHPAIDGHPSCCRSARGSRKADPEKALRINEPEPAFANSGSRLPRLGPLFVLLHRPVVRQRGHLPKGRRRCQETHGCPAKFSVQTSPLMGQMVQS